MGRWFIRFSKRTFPKLIDYLSASRLPQLSCLSDRFSSSTMAAASAASALRRAALPAALENGPHRWVMDLGTEIWQVGFAKTLGLNNSLEVQNYSHEEGLTAKYTVPETVCVGDATRKYLPCGVTAAVFDEFSTLAMMLKDK
jgi:hypothetical protein